MSGADCRPPYIDENIDGKCLVDEMQIGAWRVAHDREATARAYGRVSRSGAEECVCLFCRNFLAARSRVYTPAIIQHLRALGVNPERESEVVDYGPLPGRPGLRAGNGWFHVVGRVIAGPPDEDSFTIPEEIELRVRRTVGLVPEAFAGRPVIQVEWLGAVPWVLDEPP
jgi:hypothetical protein